MNEDNKKTYHLVFKRKIKDGINLDTVKENLTHFFKNNSTLVEQLFLKEKTILKNNLSKSQAEKYKSILESTGALCSIEESIQTNKKIKPKAESSLKKLEELEKVTRFLVRVISFNQKMIWLLLALIILSMLLSTKLYFDIQNLTPEVSIKNIPNKTCMKKIDFSSKNDLNFYSAKGLSQVEALGRWSNGASVILNLQWPKNNCQYTKIRFSLGAFLSKKVTAQSATMQFNGVKYGTIKIRLGESTPKDFVFSIPPHLFKQGSKNIIQFNIISPVSPNKLGISKDKRLLGFSFKSVVFQ